MQDGKFSLVVLDPPAAPGTQTEEPGCGAARCDGFFIPSVFLAVPPSVVLRAWQRRASRASFTMKWCLAAIVSSVSD